MSHHGNDTVKGLNKIHLPLQLAVVFLVLAELIVANTWAIASGNESYFYACGTITAAFLGYVSLVVVEDKLAWKKKIGRKLWIVAANTPKRALISAVVLIVCLLPTAWSAYGAYHQGDPAALAVRVEEILQEIELVGSPPSYEGNTVYCEAARLRFVASHNNESDTPITVKGFKVESEQVLKATDLGDEFSYKLLADSLLTRGIRDVDTYVVELDGTDVSAKFVVDKDESLPADPRNLFLVSGKAKRFTVRPGEEDPLYLAHMVFETAADGLYRARINIDYEVAGKPRKDTTKWIYVIAKQ